MLQSLIELKLNIILRSNGVKKVVQDSIFSNYFFKINYQQLITNRCRKIQFHLSKIVMHPRIVSYLYLVIENYAL